MKLCWDQCNIYTDAWQQKNLCVENNTIFTQMLENKRPFVLRTIQYLHGCLKTKDSLCREQYNIYTVPKLAPYRSFPTTIIPITVSTKNIMNNPWKCIALDCVSLRAWTALHDLHWPLPSTFNRTFSLPHSTCALVQCSNIS